MNFRDLLLPFIAGGMLLCSASAFTQTSAAPPATTHPSKSASVTGPVFAVASIHQHQGPLRVVAGYSFSGPRLMLEGYNLRLLIQEAYNRRFYRVSFAGSNMASDQQTDIYYNIAAIADGNDAPTKEQFREMLQALLADRFKLRFHRETREMLVYALVRAKNGPKFEKSGSDEVLQVHVGVHGRNQMLTASQQTMESLAEDIWQSFGPQLPVIDKTALTGSYDIQLEATPEWRIDKNPQPEDTSIFHAVEDQLGLKLERQKAAVDVLVVDHIEKPSEN